MDRGAKRIGAGKLSIREVFKLLEYLKFAQETWIRWDILPVLFGRILYIMLLLIQRGTVVNYILHYHRILCSRCNQTKILGFSVI